MFTFFARPEILALITPPSLDFHLLTPSPIVMEHGSIIDYLRWRSLISTYRAPHRFVDERLLGPYSFWHRRVEDPRAVLGPMRLQLPRS